MVLHLLSVLENFKEQTLSWFLNPNAPVQDIFSEHQWANSQDQGQQ